MNENLNDDRSVIRKLQRGDTKAFEQLFQNYSNSLYHFALKFLNDEQDAEDVLAEVFLKIWEKRKNLKDSLSFKSYVFTIAYNNVRQRFLKQAREQKYTRLFTEEYLISSKIDNNTLDYKRFSKKLNELIQQLPPRRREIFLLSYQEELKINEIANQLEISSQFVKNQLSISKKFIIEEMKNFNKTVGLLLFYYFNL